MRQRTYLLFVFLGAFGGVIFWATARCLYYLAIDRVLNMHPVMYVIVSPLYGIMIGFIAVALEAFVHRIAYKKSALLIGFSYSVPCVFFLEKWLLILFVFVNPLTINKLLLQFSKNKLA